MRWFGGAGAWAGGFGQVFSTFGRLWVWGGCLGGLISMEGWKEIGLSSFWFPLRFHVVHRRPGWAAAGSDREKKVPFYFKLSILVPRTTIIWCT